MAWRLQLSDRTIKRLDILSGKPSVLAAWTQANRLSFLDLQHGTPLGDKTLDAALTSNPADRVWQKFVADLTAPNGVFLPIARAAQSTILISTDGKLRLYEVGAEKLLLDIDGKVLPVEVDAALPLLAVHMDRTAGVIALLDSDAKLHLYKQHLRTGVFDTGLRVSPEFRPLLIVAPDGTSVFVSDGFQVAVFNQEGQVRKQRDLHYTLGAMNCSPNGRHFVTSDLDANVIRIYDASLTPTHQRFAVDLLADAKRAQLLPSTGTTSAALGPLAINNKGVLAFAVSGTVCVTNLAKLKAFPK